MALRAEAVRRLLKAISRHPRLGGGAWQVVEMRRESLGPLMEGILASYPWLRPRLYQTLVALEEARNNVVLHTGDPMGGIALVREDTSRKAVDFLFTDDGPGFLIEGMRPPYAAPMVGRQYDYRRTVDGVVSCTITGPDSIEVAFRPSAVASERKAIRRVSSSGLGLSIMAKAMDRVVYLTHVGAGNVLWLRLEAPEEVPA